MLGQLFECHLDAMGMIDRSFLLTRGLHSNPVMRSSLNFVGDEVTGLGRCHEVLLVRSIGIHHALLSDLLSKLV